MALRERVRLGLGDLDRVGGTKSLLDLTVDTELQGRKGTDHDKTRLETREETTHTEFLRQLEETATRRLTGRGLGLVHLRQQRVSRLRDRGSGETSNQTRARLNTGASVEVSSGLLLP